MGPILVANLKTRIKFVDSFVLISNSNHVTGDFLQHFTCEGNMHVQRRLSRVNLLEWIDDLHPDTGSELVSLLLVNDQKQDREKLDES